MAMECVTCPNCGSDNVQRFSVAFQSGVSDVTSHTKGLMFNGKLGVGGAKTNSVSVSAMAASTAPPQKKSMIKAFLIFGLLSVILASIIQSYLPKTIRYVADIVLVLGPFMAYRAFKYNRNVWPKLYEDWSNSWVCLKCGSRFIQ